jgi:hypothetical protein
MKKLRPIVLLTALALPLALPVVAPAKDGDVRVSGRCTGSKAPSGSFSLERHLRNRSGKDHVVGVTKNRVAAERCRAGAPI